jgi:hypothetical protein
MTASKLKYLYEKNNPDGHFFDRATMRFFGDTMRNFGVADGGKMKTLTDDGIVEVEVWDLYRKKPVNGGMHGHCQSFRKDNGQEVLAGAYFERRL